MPRRPDPPAPPVPIDEIFSLSIADVCARTGWSKSQVYQDINSGALQSYTLGRRRYVLGSSVRARIAELVATAVPIKREARFRGKDGR